jgi:hypothetical protein
MFKASPASLQTFIDTKLALTPSVIPKSNYVIMVSDWNYLKYFYLFLYCNYQVHRFLITLYISHCKENLVKFALRSAERTNVCKTANGFSSLNHKLKKKKIEANLNLRKTDKSNQSRHLPHLAVQKYTPSPTQVCVRHQVSLVLRGCPNYGAICSWPTKPSAVHAQLTPVRRNKAVTQLS